MHILLILGVKILSLAPFIMAVEWGSPDYTKYDS